MSAFDAAARGGGAGRAGGGRSGGGGGGGGAFGAAASAPRGQATGFGAASAGAPAAASAAAYQGADRMYTSACDAVEKELRKLTTLTAALKKGADSIGGPRDSADVRAKVCVPRARARRGGAGEAGQWVGAAHGRDRGGGCRRAAAAPPAGRR